MGQERSWTKRKNTKINFDFERRATSLTRKIPRKEKKAE